MNRKERPVWRVGRSIMLELQGIMIALFDRSQWAGAPEHLEEIRTLLAPDWPELSRQHVGAATGLALGASIVGVVETDDYSRATLALRRLTLDEAIERVEQEVIKQGLPVETATMRRVDRFAELTVRWMEHRYRALGLLDATSTLGHNPVGRRARQLGSVLQGEPGHVDFWHWIDRFYFESYAPWRKQHEVHMEAHEARAREALGEMQGTHFPEAAEWLPPQNPLVVFPQMIPALARNRATLFLWVQPLGLFDACFPTADGVVVSIGEPEEEMAVLQELSLDIATKAKALGDPTRLMILRLIRHFPLDNTQMAGFLEIARPTVSVHTKLLREAGLITTERGTGRSVAHHMNVEALRQLFDALHEFLAISVPSEGGGQDKG